MYAFSYFICYTISPGIVGFGTVLFSIKPPKEVIFVEFELVVLQGSLLTQIVVVQFPFSQFVVTFAWSCAYVYCTIGVLDVIKIRLIIEI
jgi:hypothetical protein